MIATTFLVLTLAATPSKGSTPSKPTDSKSTSSKTSSEKPAAEKPAKTTDKSDKSEAEKGSNEAISASDSDFELIIPEKMLEDFLVAAAPIDRKITHNVSLLGKVTVDMHLTNPKVKVTPQGIFVTMDYDLKGPGGITSRGRATPRLELRAVRGKDLLQGRLTGASLSATGGMEIPVDDLVDPFEFPASAGGPLEIGDKKVIATGRAKDVVLEKGRVRVKGEWEFEKPKPTADAKDRP